MRDHDDGGPADSRLDDGPVDQIATLPVEGRMRLVEEQQLAVPDHRHREGAPTSLARRQPAVPTIRDRLEAEPTQTDLRVTTPQPRETGMEEQVVPHREVVVAEALVADQRDPTTYLVPGGLQAVAEDGPLARGDRQESASTCRSVVFPAPLAPVTRATSPGSTRRSRRRNTG